MIFRASASPEETKNALDTRVVSMILDELFPLDRRGHEGHRHVLLDLAGVTGADARHYPTPALKKLALQRIGGTGLLIMVGDVLTSKHRTGGTLAAVETAGPKAPSPEQRLADDTHHAVDPHHEADLHLVAAELLDVEGQEHEAVLTREEEEARDHGPSEGEVR